MAMQWQMHSKTHNKEVWQKQKKEDLKMQQFVSKDSKLPKDKQ